jgi:hypothetical protein
MTITGDTPAAAAPTFAAALPDTLGVLDFGPITQCRACRCLVEQGAEAHHARTCTAVTESYRTDKENQL